MNELLPSVLLVAASLGIATVLSTIVWCWVKWSGRNQKQYRRW
jgi:hypothetical protein